MLFSLTEANKILDKDPSKQSNVAIMSIDSSALFPSLHIVDILTGLWRLVMETPLELLNVDMKEIGKYLYVMYERDELVRQKVISCIPRR